MTLYKNKTLELTKSIFSLIFIYIGIEFLAAIILIPFAIVLDLIFKVNLLGNQYDGILDLIVNCTDQVLGIYFFTKIYRKKEFNVPKINNHMSPTIKSSLESFIEHDEIFNANPILAFISVAILAPIVEEIIFRGIIFNEADKYKGGAFPIIISALLFGLAHMQPIQIVYTFIVGLIFGFVYSKTHSLLIVMFLHMLNNLLTLFPEPFSTFISIIQILCIIPMIYLLKKLYKESTV